MATELWTTPLNHANDNGWRNTHSELSDYLTNIGIPKTTDTGQVNWLTSTLPPNTSTTAYEIRYINDFLHSTDPIYFKLEISNENSGGDNRVPFMYITVGTGTNGSGTITGNVTPRLTISSFNPIKSNTDPKTSFLCYLPGYLALCYKKYSQRDHWNTIELGFSFFAISRFTDSSGTPIPGGFYVYYSDSQTNHPIQRFTINTNLNSVTNDGMSTCFFPGSGPTLVNGQAQVMRHFGMQRAVTCIPNFLSYYTTEIGYSSTFTATPVGVTPITYLALGANGSGVMGAPGNASIHNSTLHSLAIRWE
jgi:hypothetical protein